jgi:hypothetical protein
MGATKLPKDPGWLILLASRFFSRVYESLLDRELACSNERSELFAWGERVHQYASLRNMRFCWRRISYQDIEPHSQVVGKKVDIKGH